MFGIDSPELLVIAIVALVVIGPKELPGMLRSWGKWMSKTRAMASEFRGHVDEMVRQSELDEVKKQLEAVKSGVDLEALDPTREIKGALQEGMAEGQKTVGDMKSMFDNPLAEPDSAPQIAAEAPSAVAEPAVPSESVQTASAETASAETASEVGAPPESAAEPAPVAAPATAEAAPVAAEEKPAKAVAAG
jgi:sec-independent protein translocase protein TatB